MVKPRCEPRFFWSLKPNDKLLCHSPACCKEKQKKNIWVFESHSYRIIQDRVAANISKPFQVQWRVIQTLMRIGSTERCGWMWATLPTSPLRQGLNALNCCEICNEIIRRLGWAFFPIVNCVNLQWCSRCWMNRNRLNENSILYRVGGKVITPGNLILLCCSVPPLFKHPYSL